MSIFKQFLTVSDCKYYCNQVAAKLNYNTQDYFYDKNTNQQYPGDANIYNYNMFYNYESWRIKFNLAKPKTIQNIGLEQYVSENKMLVFYLTIKDFSFIYVCKFIDPKLEETIQQETYVKDNVVYKPEANGQYKFML